MGPTHEPEPRAAELDPGSLLAQNDWLRRLARRLVRDENVADDVVQDTLVAALEHPPARLASVGQEDGLRAWLSTIARNLARRRYAQSELRRHHERRAASAREPSAEAPEELELLRTQKLLTDALLALREPYRSALILRFRKGLSYRVLAKRQGIQQAAARKRVSRGLALLRTELDGPDGSARAEWLPALVVFARRPAGVAVSTVTIGGITVGTKTLTAVAATGVALFAVWQTQRTTPSPAPVQVPAAARATELAAVTPADQPAPAGVRAPATEDRPEPSAAPTAPDAPPLDEDRLVRGRVVDPSGAALRDAHVELRRDELRSFSVLDLEHDERGQRIAHVTTDENGEFALEATPGLPLDVEASHPDWARGLHTGAYAGEYVELELAAPARFVARVVREDGSAVANAVVRGLRADQTHMQIFEGATDARGEASFEGLESGPVRVQVLPEEDAWLFRVSLVLAAGETTERTLTVDSGHEIQGRVVDATTGLPIEGAEVGQGWTFSKSVRSGPDGRYRLRGFATEGVYEIHARAPGYGRAEHELPSAREGLVSVDFALQRGISARGRLVDTSGEPIGNAYVACLASPDWRGTRTDADGHFGLQDLQPDAAYCLFAVAQGHGASAFEFPREPLPSGVYDLGEVALHPAGLLEGRVIDTAGQPLPDLPVVLVATYDDRFALSGPLDQTTGGSYVDEREGRTDARGRFRFGELAPGTFELAAGESGQHISRSAAIYVGPGDVRDGVEIVLDAGLEISGVVVDEQGAPVPGVILSIHPEPPTEGRMAQLMTGVEGRFHGDGFALGTYKIQAFPTELDDATARRALRPKMLEGVDPFTGELRIVVPSSSPTSGRVVDARGTPVLHAQVVARNGDDEIAAVEYTDGMGAFVLQLEPGTRVELAAKPPQAEGMFYLTDTAVDDTTTVLADVAAGTTDLRLELSTPLGE